MRTFEVKTFSFVHPNEGVQHRVELHDPEGNIIQIPVNANGLERLAFAIADAINMYSTAAALRS